MKTPEERKLERQALSNLSSGGHIPLACIATAGDEMAARLYAAYNRHGEASTAGLNHQGRPCPAWEDLTDNVRAKWRGAAAVQQAAP